MQILYSKNEHVLGKMKDLVAEPVIIRVGDISTADEFSRKMSDACNTGQGVVPIYIDSYGGSIYTLLTMLSNIESCPLPVATICAGKAMSAGAILLASGNKNLRFIDPYATVMIHPASSWNVGNVNEQKNNLQEMERLNTIIFRKMAMSCGYKNLDFFINLLNENGNLDTFFDSMNAKQLKIVDHIGIPEFRVSVSANIDFVFEDHYPEFNKAPEKKKSKKKKK